MGYPTTEVDTTGLAGIGSMVERSAAAFKAPLDPLHPAEALTGWASGAALTAAGTAWTEFLGNLTGEVQAFGAGMSRAAAAYRAADTQSADRVGRAGGKPVPR